MNLSLIYVFLLVLGGLRSSFIDIVATARGVLRPPHTERLAQAQTGASGRRRRQPGLSRRPRHGRPRRKERPQSRHPLAIPIDDVATRRRLNQATSPIPDVPDTLAAGHGLVDKSTRFFLIYRLIYLTRHHKNVENFFPWSIPVAVYLAELGQNLTLTWP